MDIKTVFFKINLTFLMIALAVGGYTFMARTTADGSREAALQAWASSSSVTAPTNYQTCEPGKARAISGDENSDCSIQRQADSIYKMIIEAPATSAGQRAIVKK